MGEALVGNDGIDQLNMFNKSLAQFCSDGRTIDGLVLTKFDTIDDKVGATLSMTYKTASPSCSSAWARSTRTSSCP